MAGLLLASQDASDLTDEEVVGRQRQLAEVVRSVDVPDGLAVSALSLELLLEDNEIGGEIPLPGGMGLVNIALDARNGWSSQSGWKLVGPLS